MTILIALLLLHYRINTDKYNYMKSCNEKGKLLDAQKLLRLLVPTYQVLLRCACYWYAHSKRSVRLFCFVSMIFQVVCARRKDSSPTKSLIFFEYFNIIIIY